MVRKHVLEELKLYRSRGGSDHFHVIANINLFLHYTILPTMPYQNSGIYRQKFACPLTWQLYMLPLGTGNFSMMNDPSAQFLEAQSPYRFIGRSLILVSSDQMLGRSTS
jgi:hypothetical protein